ncbi:spore coat U domain-containing protein, partial [Desulfobacterales bacterium HSG16]|nr:spore coat U domain-containing protein [Desulfobacterales bacterium HSG16]
FFLKSLMKYLQIALLIAQLLLNSASCLACDLLNANVGDFGQSDGAGNIGNMQIANLQVRCITQFRVGLDGGLNYSGVRRLSDGKGNYISYYLWQDSASNAEWGSKGMPVIVPHPADSLSENGSGSLQTFTVYGTAFPASSYPPGSYTDIVRSILTYVPFGSGVPLETDLYISLNLVGNCTLNLVGLGDFGEWPVGSSDLKSVPLGTITVNCNPPGMTYAIGMDAGMNFRGGMRHMQSGGKLIPYIIYADSGRSQPWGDSGLSLFEPGYAESHPSLARKSISTGKTQSFFVWGDAIISTSPSGVYNDTVSVTIVWP